MSGAMPILAKALCKDQDPELFELDNMDSLQVARAKSICAACPDNAPCRKWSVEHEEHFFRGGMTAAERTRERRSLGIKLSRPEANARRARQQNTKPRISDVTDPTALNLDLPHLDIYVSF